MNLKHIAVTALGTAAVVFIIFKIPALKTAITGLPA